MSYRINNYEINQNSLTVQTAHTFTIKKIAEIDVDAAYRSPYVDTNSRFPSIYYADMGISKKILKNKGRVRFYVSDLFNTASSINFSSGKKFSNKKIEQGNVEEKNRIRN